MAAAFLVTLREGLGSFLGAIFGHSGNLELLEVAFYFAYVALAFWYLFGVARTLSKEIADSLAEAPQERSDQVDEGGCEDAALA